MDKDRRALRHFQNAGESFDSALQNVGASGGETLLAVPIDEQRALFRESVNVRRLVAHHALVVVADVIAPNDQDVGLF